METSDVTRKLLVENDRAVTTIARDPNNARNGVTCKGRPGRHLFNAHNVASRVPKLYFQSQEQTWRKKKMTDILRKKYIK